MLGAAPDRDPGPRPWWCEAWGGAEGGGIEAGRGRTGEDEGGGAVLALWTTSRRLDGRGGVAEVRLGCASESLGTDRVPCLSPKQGGVPALGEGDGRVALILTAAAAAPRRRGTG